MVSQQECNKLEKLDFNTNQKIAEGLKGGAKGCLPIGQDRLRVENIMLHDNVR
jgi:hypothetical protein